MLRLFRINDPFRVIIAIVLFLAVRIPVLLLLKDVFQFEVVNLALGAKQAEGSLLYKSIDDNTAPFAAYVFKVLNLLFGESLTALRTFATLLIITQAVILNYIVLKLGVIKERNYVPSFIYMVLANICIEFYSLSSAMMATTFIIAYLYNLLSIIKSGSNEERVFKTGLFIGVACLFNFSCIVLFPLTLLFFLLWTNVDIKRYWSFSFGVIFPILALAMYYYWNDAFFSYAYNFIYKSFIIENIRYWGFGEYYLFFTPFLIVGVIGFFKAVNGRGYVQFQNKSFNIFFLIILFSPLIYFFSIRSYGAHFFMFLPALSLLLTNYFLEIRKKWQRALAFHIFLVVCLAYSFSSSKLGLQDWYQEKSFAQLHSQYKGKRVLNLSNDFSWYYQRKSATVFFNWQLSKEYFSDLDDYENVRLINNSIKKDMPEVIIDPNNRAEKLFFRIPKLKKEFKKDGENYVHISN